MHRVIICLFLCLSLTACTVGIIKKESLVPDTSVAWQVETVDSSARGHSSLVIDSSGYPCISYQVDGGSSQDLAYARWTGSQWMRETVATMGLGSSDTSLALDGSGYPHISYAACDPFSCPGKFAGWTGDSWSITEDMDGYGSLLIDSSDDPHISYKHGNAVGDTSLKYAHRVAGVWILSTVEGGPISNPSTSLKLDGSGHPHISYYRGDSLKYAHWTGSAWVSQTVDSATAAPFNLGQHTSMVLDTDDDPRVVYYDGATKDLKYAEQIGSAWVIQTVDSTGDVGKYASLVLDSHELPHISYYDADSRSVKHAHWTGSSWQIRTVEGDVGDGGVTSLAVDDADRLHLSYYYYGEESDRALRYAWGDVISYTHPVSSPLGCPLAVVPLGAVFIVIGILIANGRKRTLSLNSTLCEK